MRVGAQYGRYQRGRASIEEMTARGTIWVNCHTSVNRLEAQGAEFNFSANAGLDAGRVEFNNTNVSMARGAIFTMEEYNADEKGRREQIHVYRRRRSKGRGPDFGEGVYPQRA